jgi:hypothetical protein
LPWDHALDAAGQHAEGDWRIRAASSRVDRFEVRRWQHEADAREANGLRVDLIQDNANKRFGKLSVAALRLTVSDEIQTLAAVKGAKAVSFNGEMAKGRRQNVKAELPDNIGHALRFIMLGLFERPCYLLSDSEAFRKSNSPS